MFKISDFRQNPKNEAQIEIGGLGWINTTFVSKYFKEAREMAEYDMI